MKMFEFGSALICTDDFSQLIFLIRRPIQIDEKGERRILIAGGLECNIVRDRSSQGVL
jgi:hypothetical protein